MSLYMYECTNIRFYVYMCLCMNECMYVYSRYGRIFNVFM